MIQITGLSQIACGDCLEIMQEMPSASVDAIVTDPPYMLQIRSDGVGALSPWGDLMNSAYWYAEMLRQFKRLLRSEGACLVFMNWRGLPTLMKAGYMADFPIRGVLTWSKQWPGTGHFFRASSELLCLFVREKFKMRNRCLLDVQYFPPVPTAKRLHSAEKPVELLRFAIENISNDAEHDTVFDHSWGAAARVLQQRWKVGASSASSWMNGFTMLQRSVLRGWGNNRVFYSTPGSHRKV